MAEIMHAKKYSVYWVAFSLLLYRILTNSNGQVAEPFNAVDRGQSILHVKIIMTQKRTVLLLHLKDVEMSSSDGQIVLCILVCNINDYF